MKKKWKKACFLIGIFIILYCLLCHFYQPKLDENFLELGKCPACYGNSLCHRILDPTSNVILNNKKFNIIRVLNVRNVFFGELHSRKVVFKKLAQNWERNTIDSSICKAQKKLSRHSTSYENSDEICNVGQALKYSLNFYERNISLLIESHSEIFEFSDAVKCPSARIIETLFEKFKQLEDQEDVDIIARFVTLLAVNPEPLILTAFADAEPCFGRFLGACGRVAAFRYDGVPLTDVQDGPWLDRVSYALQLLQLATRLSSGPVKLYLTDPRPDNFAVDEAGRVRLVDAENVILVDSLTDGLSLTEHENDGLGCPDCLSFIPEELCSHTAADHNYFAICKSLLSSTPFEKAIPGGLLHTPPLWVATEFPFLFLLVEICSYPSYSPYRHLTETHLTLPPSVQRGKPVEFSPVGQSEIAFVKKPEGNAVRDCTKDVNSLAPESEKTQCDRGNDFFVERNLKNMSRSEAARHLVNALRTMLTRRT